MSVENNDSTQTVTQEQSVQVEKQKSVKKGKSVKSEVVANEKTRKKRTHRWTEANRKSFYEKCVPARKASLEAKKKIKMQSSS